MRFDARSSCSAITAPAVGVRTKALSEVRTTPKKSESGCIDELTDHLRDGDEFELVVRRTGRKVTTRFELTEPHVYGMTSQPKSSGCPECQKIAE